MNHLERLCVRRGELQWEIEKFETEIEERKLMIKLFDAEINRLRPEAIETNESAQAKPGAESKG